MARCGAHRLLLAVLVAVVVGAASASVAHAAGPGQYGPPSWLPLRHNATGGSFKVSCVRTNCSGPYHGYWAIDFSDPSAKAGAPVYAAGPGQVSGVVGSHSACGGPGTPSNYVNVNHGSGIVSRYLHLKTLTVANGQWVDEATQIGTVGSVGYTDPCPAYHLHFQVNSNGTPVDPGNLKACHGGTLINYPSALGYSSWNSVPYLGASVYSDGTACGAPPPPPDRDADGVPDSKDDCPDSPGVSQLAGCRGASGIEGQGELARYRSATSSDHFVSTTGAGMPAGMVFESSLGQLVGVPVAGTRPLYSCKISWDQFLSQDSECEGQQKLGLQGYIYKSRPPGLPSQPVRRCVVPGPGDHFASNDLNCEGQQKEDVLGYAIVGGELSRDGDNVPDTQDRCPDRRGPASTGGCPPKSANRCRVPRLRGKTLKQARRALEQAHCRLGRVKKPSYIRGREKLRVIRQRPTHGQLYPAGRRVRVDLGYPSR
jgi:hypothetical protein